MKYLQIFADLSLALAGLGLMIVVVMAFSELFTGYPGRASSLFDRETRQQDLKDYHNPKIRFGGYLGILKKLVFFSAICLGLWLVAKITLFLLDII